MHTKVHGYSWFELCVVMTIITLLASLSIPGLTRFFREAKTDLIQSQVLTALHFARQQAHSSHAAIGVCGYHSSGECVRNWTQGIRIYFSQPHGDIAENTVAIHQLHLDGSKLLTRFFQQHPQAVLFASDEFMQDINAAIWFCPANNLHPAWAIFISNLGRIRVRLPNHLGEIKDGQSKKLMCV